jgi:hypothetical protein
MKKIQKRIVILYAKCSDCGNDLPEDAKFCLNCGTEVAKIQKDVYQVSAEGLVGKVKEIIRDAKIKRVVIKDEKGQDTLVYPGYLGSDRGCSNIGSSALACGSRGYRWNSCQLYGRS